MSQRADCEDKVFKDALKKEFYRRNRIVWKSLLSPSNKVKAFNSICVGVLSYSLVLSTGQKWKLKRWTLESEKK